MSMKVVGGAEKVAAQPHRSTGVVLRVVGEPVAALKQSVVGSVRDVPPWAAPSPHHERGDNRIVEDLQRALTTPMFALVGVGMKITVRD